MSDSLKIKLSLSKKKLQKLNRNNKLSALEIKQNYLGFTGGTEKRLLRLRQYYKASGLYSRYRIKKYFKNLSEKRIKNKFLNLCRCLYLDILREPKSHDWGIYQFVALPGEGKTISMVAHMERFRERMKKADKPYVIATNFNYVHQTETINHWSDIIRISKHCYQNKIRCLIAIDEVQITFDSSDWKSFPPEMLSVLSFNRKYGLQFLCSCQVFDRIPKKIRDIANFTIICKNVLHFDRYFKSYYFSKKDYEDQFEGVRKKAKFTRSFVADDNFYKLYDTLQQVDKMTADAQKEKELREEAFNILFGNMGKESA